MVKVRHREPAKGADRPEPKRGSPALCVVRFRSGGDKDALPEEVEAGAAIHGALYRLQPGDLALRGAGAPRRGDGGGYGLPVALEPAGEAVEQGSAGGLHPRRQGSIGAVDVRATLAQQVREGDGQRASAHQIRRGTGEMTDEGPFLGIEPIRRRADHACTTPG